MTRTLYLHIGAHRTATTSVQRFMFQNFERLLEAGVFYPFRVRRHARFVNEIMTRHHSARSAAKVLNERADNWERNLKKSIPTLVLSDEDICRLTNLKRLAGLKKYFDVKVIFTLRRQDLWLESWYFQNIKWQWNKSLYNCTFDEFMAQKDAFHWINYDCYLPLLESEFGRENIQLSVFEKEQMPLGPIQAFAEHIGLEIDKSSTQPDRENYSFTPEVAEMIRHLPLHSIAEPERDILVRTLQQVDKNAFQNTNQQSERIMPLQRRKDVLTDYQDGNRNVAQRYFGREQLFFAPLPPEDAPLANLQLPQSSAEVLEKFVGPLIKQLVSNGTISAAKKSS